jgi:hypothetical protein
MDFVLFPSLKDTVTAKPRSNDLQDFFTVEIEEDVEQYVSLKVASALPSQSKWKYVCSSDHYVSLCLQCLSYLSRDPKKQSWLDGHYKTLIVEQLLKMDNIILFYTSFPQNQALLHAVHVRVVALKLRSVLFVAYHTSTGHDHASFKDSF